MIKPTLQKPITIDSLQKYSIELEALVHSLEYEQSELIKDYNELADELAFERLDYLNEFNIDKDLDGVIEFENKKYDTKDIVMIKHTGPYKIYAGKTKNFYRLKLQTKDTFITIVNEGLTDGFNFISNIQRNYIR